jgi:hypothetical protein
MHFPKLPFSFLIFGSLFFTGTVSLPSYGYKNDSLILTNHATGNSNFSGPNGTNLDIDPYPDINDSVGINGVYSVKCETSDASPTDSEVASVIKQIGIYSDAFCIQRNMGGSKCTTFAVRNGGQGSLCGPPNNQVSCGDFAKGLQKIWDLCKRSDGRAGGTCILGNRLKAVLH